MNQRDQVQNVRYNVDALPAGHAPSEADEEQVLFILYDHPNPEGFYVHDPTPRDVELVGAEAMLAEARRWVGTTDAPNELTRAYADRNGVPEFVNAAWSGIAVTEWAHRSGNAAAVLPAGVDRASPAWHAHDFLIGPLARCWSFPDTVESAEPGALLYFDWGLRGRNRMAGCIDHVGLLERVLHDGRLQTIEGNTAGACRRRVRNARELAGVVQPAYVQ